MSITVGEVRTSPDLKVATAFVLPLGGKDKEQALLLLRQNRYEIRRAVAKTLALKYAPEIRYQIDETFDQMDETRRILEQEAVRRDIENDSDGGDADGGGE